MTQVLTAPDPSDLARSPVSQDVVSLSDPTSATAALQPRVVGQPATVPAVSTLKLYAGDWTGFVAWCRRHHCASLPATGDTMAAYLLACASGLSRGALGRRRAAIGAMHRQANLPVPRLEPATRKALRNASKARGGGTHKAAPTAATLVQVAARCPRDLAGLRDRALLLLAAATQRSARRRPNNSLLSAGPSDSLLEVGVQVEVPRLFLLALEAEDVRFTATGVVLRLKTRIDEPDPSRTLTLSRSTVQGACPVRALEDWLRSSETTFGPVFRKVDRWGNVEHSRLGPDAWRGILARRGGLRPTARPTAG